jgi:hypothetical protein
VRQQLRQRDGAQAAQHRRPAIRGSQAHGPQTTMCFRLTLDCLLYCYLAPVGDDAPPHTHIAAACRAQTPLGSLWGCCYLVCHAT